MKTYYSYIIIALVSIGLVLSRHTFANPAEPGTKKVTVTLTKEQETRYRAAVKSGGGDAANLCGFCPHIPGHRLLKCKAVSTKDGIKTECTYGK